jgi:hypothetical protein
VRHRSRSTRRCAGQRPSPAGNPCRGLACVRFGRSAGSKGETGADGGSGPASGPGGFVVKDSNDVTAGPLLSVTDDMFWFYFKGHQFRVVDTALSLPGVWLFYDSTDCTGPPFTFASYRYGRQAALRSFDTAHTTCYARAAAPVAMTWHSQLGAGGCTTANQGADLVALDVIATGDFPAPLVGPLRYVPAN